MQGDSIYGSQNSLNTLSVSGLIKSGMVTVNGKKVKPSFIPKAGDIIEATRRTKYWNIPEDIPLDMIYIDSDILVVNKTPGMVVHPAEAIPQAPWPMPLFI